MTTSTRQKCEQLCTAVHVSRVWARPTTCSFDTVGALTRQRKTPGWAFGQTVTTKSCPLQINTRAFNNGQQKKKTFWKASRWEKIQSDKALTDTSNFDFGLTFLVSFDVKSLFTSVPVPEALDAVREIVEEDADFATKNGIESGTAMELLRVCLTTTSFQFQARHYELADGLGVTRARKIFSVILAKVEVNGKF